jgi:hypothetical protein
MGSTSAIRTRIQFTEIAVTELLEDLAQPFTPAQKRQTRQHQERELRGFRRQEFLETDSESESELTSGQDFDNIHHTSAHQCAGTHVSEKSRMSST